MFGKKVYELLKEVKYAFDPNNIFNPGKIVDAPAMDVSLRYTPDRIEPEIETIMDFSDAEEYSDWLKNVMEVEIAENR